MRRLWTLGIIGLIAFLVLLAATLPARVLLDRVPQVQATGVTGTIWSGKASSVAIQGQPLGALEWQLRALPLFTGRADLRAELKRSDGKAVAQCVVTLSRDATCEHIVANLPIEALPLASVPRGWTGRIDANFSRLDMLDGWPVAATGVLNVTDVAQANGTAFGSYRIQFPATSSEPVAPDTLLGALQDTGGPLEIAGVVRFQPDRTYVIDAKVATRADASQSMTRALEFLGPPDAQGRRDFSMSGTF